MSSRPLDGQNYNNGSMTTLEIALCSGIIAALIIPSWFLPRKLGIIGIPFAHILISFITLGAIIFDFIRGVVPDPDFIWLLGNACWIGLANVVLLPVTSFAAYRNYLGKKKMSEVGITRDQ